MANNDHDPCWRWRNRALDAEQRVKELLGEIASLEYRLEGLRIALFCTGAAWIATIIYFLTK